METKMNCLVVDDEPVARKGIAEYVGQVEFLELAGQCDGAAKASSIISGNRIDLIFLDIQMPRMTGIDFIRTLRNPPLIILTTAYSEYALEGYALDIVDYLMKPVTFGRFLKASQKALEIFSLKRSAEQPRPADSGYFFVKCDGKFEKVFYHDVRYIEALQNYAIIHTESRKLITYITMTSLEHQLPPDRFLKVHKSYIISIPQVKAIEGNELLIGDTRVPVSRALRERVVQQILGNKLFRR